MAQFLIGNVCMSSNRNTESRMTKLVLKICILLGKLLLDYFHCNLKGRGVCGHIPAVHGLL